MGRGSFGEDSPNRGLRPPKIWGHQFISTLNRLVPVHVSSTQLLAVHTLRLSTSCVEDATSLPVAARANETSKPNHTSMPEQTSAHVDNSW